ncbi:phosphate ABC transporter substrate-binding protein PstS [Microcoleus sp. LEGE 07076]|uniref:phosphate ABC transporter substrate-binding protein PstS n=1 Tax=Microcoleus sp. LEGE 07076 TaxID=915322 RepID=UPI0018819C89|nr:phosphate ABC transporter substrate-binding protein PstS [Microcoleus sp. LEGE 07076]MBE9186840.1 phosphate ABC transporter substrate-binding protein PstS [Microcoleus sp. LEGE 07076]
MVFFTKSWRRGFIVTLAVAAFSLSLISSAVAAVTLNGSGATFPKPLYDRYFSQMRSATGITVNYEGTGSGAGIKALISGTVDFAGSDALMSSAQIAQVKRGVMAVPTAGGAVAVVYNLPGVNNVRLSANAMKGIFEGKITRWNDPQIAGISGQAKNLPNTAIRVVVRADSSGTSFIFSNHLQAIGSSIKGAAQPSWPGGPLSGQGNPGVAGLVKQTAGAIGYVQDTYARQNKLQTAFIQNKKGRFVDANLAEAEKAFSGEAFPADFRLVEGNPNDGYPIVGLTWLLIYKQYPAAKADAIKKMVNWVMTTGQGINKQLEYTSIPQGTAQKVIQTVNQSVVARG